MSAENSNFKLKPIAELLDGTYNFFIPSYQRGYRWGKKEVTDLLEDIWDFARNAKSGEFYCLQPIVIEKRDEKQWTVIDGQQRLTTLLLLLKYFKSKNDDIKQPLYTLHYDTRPTLDFNNIEQKSNIDSYYIYQAQEYINKWFEKTTVKKSKIEEVLFDVYGIENDEPQVKFIWYVAENNKSLDSIKTFNNLNKGKIRLTNAELIKALFSLSSKSNQTEFALEWNEIENSLQDQQFWRFLCNKSYNPATRIDLIFDFITEKPIKADDDFAYRKFQLLYDKKTDECWNKWNIKTLDEAWLTVKQIFQLFRYWYEESNLYHYIGYLISIGVTHKVIYDKIHNSPKDQMLKLLEDIIIERTNITEDKLSTLSYQEPDLVRKILLLLNIEFCSTSNTYRFPFDKYKEENWDIEHIASKTENSLQSNADKIKWLEYLKVIKPKDETMISLKGKALSLLEKLKENGKESKDEFSAIYEQILSHIEQDSIFDGDKDSLGNLTLLDSKTNRSYGNALFQTKRQSIIENDMQGYFVPPCTRNIFLKYYSYDDTNTSQWENLWSEKDAENYLTQIRKIISKFYLKKEN